MPPSPYAHFVALRLASTASNRHKTAMKQLVSLLLLRMIPDSTPLLNLRHFPENFLWHTALLGSIVSQRGT